MSDTTIIGTIYAIDDAHKSISVECADGRRWLVQPEHWTWKSPSMYATWMDMPTNVTCAGLQAAGMSLLMRATVTVGPQKSLEERVEALEQFAAKRMQPTVRSSDTNEPDSPASLNTLSEEDRRVRGRYWPEGDPPAYMNTRYYPMAYYFNELNNMRDKLPVEQLRQISGQLAELTESAAEMVRQRK